MENLNDYIDYTKTLPEYRPFRKIKGKNMPVVQVYGEDFIKFNTIKDILNSTPSAPQPIIVLPEECVFVPMADKLGIDINLAAKLYDAIVERYNRRVRKPLGQKRRVKCEVCGSTKVNIIHKCVECESPIDASNWRDRDL